MSIPIKILPYILNFTLSMPEGDDRKDLIIKLILIIVGLIVACLGLMVFIILFRRNKANRKAELLNKNMTENKAPELLMEVVAKPVQEIQQTSQKVEEKPAEIPKPEVKPITPPINLVDEPVQIAEKPIIVSTPEVPKPEETKPVSKPVMPNPFELKKPNGAEQTPEQKKQEILNRIREIQSNPQGPKYNSIEEIKIAAGIPVNKPSAIVPEIVQKPKEEEKQEGVLPKIVEPIAEEKDLIDESNLQGEIPQTTLMEEVHEEVTQEVKEELVREENSSTVLNQEQETPTQPISQVRIQEPIVQKVIIELKSEMPIHIITEENKVVESKPIEDVKPLEPQVSEGLIEEDNTHSLEIHEPIEGVPIEIQSGISDAEETEKLEIEMKTNIENFVSYTETENAVVTEKSSKKLTFSEWMESINKN